MASFIALDGTVGDIKSTTLPAHLAKKQRVVSPGKATLAREAKAAATRGEILKERVDLARAHNDVKVGEAQALKASFKENGMEILGAGEAVPLPAHLEARLGELPGHTSAQLLEKEQSAHAAREQLLSARVEQAKAHDAKVAEAQALKASFKENGMEILGAGEAVPLPAHLQARLDSMPKHTAEQYLGKEQSAHTQREQLLSARVAGCTAHEARAAEVRERKTEFKENGMEVLGAGEAVKLPAHLQARLDSMPKRTAEQILERGTKAAANRDTLLGDKVASAKAHDEVVQARLGAKKRKAEEEAATTAPMEE